jgi:hypothetical protein
LTLLSNNGAWVSLVIQGRRGHRYLNVIEYSDCGHSPGLCAGNSPSLSRNEIGLDEIED